MSWSLVTEPSAAGNQYSAGGSATAVNPASPTLFPTPPAGAWRQALDTGNAGNLSGLVIPASGPLTYNGDIVLTQAGTGIILLSPTGMTAWRLFVANDGALARQSVSFADFAPLGQWTVELELSGTGNDWSNETANGPLYNILQGDLKLTFPGSGVILWTPNGSGPYRIGAANDGAPFSQSQATPSGPQTPIPVGVTPTGAWGLLAELSAPSNQWSLDVGGFVPPVSPVMWKADFVIGFAGAGVVCTTPNGLHSYRIGVDDSGAIFSQQVS